MGRSRRKGRLRRLAAGERGIVAMEFVLIAPILLALLFGITDFGHAFFMKQMATNAAREAARYGVVYADPKHPLDTIGDIIGIRQVAIKYMGGASITITAADVKVTNPAGASGTSLTVEVKATKNWWVLWMLTAPRTDIYGVSTMNHE